jgi:hypothetical protein
MLGFRKPLAGDGLVFCHRRCRADQLARQASVQLAGQGWRLA